MAIARRECNHGLFGRSNAIGTIDFLIAFTRTRALWPWCRLSLRKGRGRVRVIHGNLRDGHQPLTLVLSPCVRGEARRLQGKAQILLWLRTSFAMTCWADF